MKFGLVFTVILTIDYLYWGLLSGSRETLALRSFKKEFLWAALFAGSFILADFLTLAIHRVALATTGLSYMAPLIFVTMVTLVNFPLCRLVFKTTEFFDGFVVVVLNTLVGGVFIAFAGELTKNLLPLLGFVGSAAGIIAAPVAIGVKRLMSSRSIPHSLRGSPAFLLTVALLITALTPLVEVK